MTLCLLLLGLLSWRKSKVHWKYYKHIYFFEKAEELRDFTFNSLEKGDGFFIVMGTFFKFFGPFFITEILDDDSSNISARYKKWAKIYIMLWWPIFGVLAWLWVDSLVL